MTSKRRRVVLSKPSKDACRTCRIRRVKCDEKRPACERCLSTGRTCDGYPPIPTRDTPSSERALLPSGAARPHTGLSPSLIYAHGGVSATDVERNAFTFFLQEIVPPLERLFGSRQWVQLALQLGAELPTVFDAVVAVGCMARSRARVHVTDHMLTQLKTGMKEGLALQQYCKATLSLRKYINDAALNRASIEPVLICSLLFVLYEIFHGEAKAALSHLHHGRRALQTVVSTSSKSPNFQLSPLSQSAKPELYSAFDVLNTESVLSDIPVTAPQPQDHYTFTVIDGLLPSRFDSVEQAKHSLDHLMAETLHWRDELLLIAAYHLTNLKLDSLSVAARHCVIHCLSRSVDTSRHPSLLGRKDVLITAHERWLHMLTALPVKAARQGLILMQIQQFYSYFLIVTSRDTTEMPLDRFDNEFKRVLDLADRYLNNQARLGIGPIKPASRQHHPSFSLEAGPLSAVFLISLKCRNQALRSRALNLLRHVNRREGLQWSGELSIYADCIVEFEEARAKESGTEDYARPLDWWFQRITEPTRSPSLSIQGVGHHEIRVIGCRYLQEDCSGLELVELRGSGIPPLHLQELRRMTIPTLVKV